MTRTAATWRNVLLAAAAYVAVGVAVDHWTFSAPAGFFWHAMAALFWPLLLLLLAR